MADVLHIGSGAPRVPAAVAADGGPRITLLGGFGLLTEGRAVAVPVAVQRVVALLALRGRTGRSRLAGTLWPETTEVRALANLRTVVWRAHQVCAGLVVADHDCLALRPDAEVDVSRVVRAAHDVLDGHPADDRAEPSFQYVQGDLLPDWNDEWLVVDRERLRQLRLHVLEALAGRLAAADMFGRAMEVALAALQADPLRESAHRAVIRIHLAEGNLAEAVAAYRECRRVLARELGVEPSAQTSALLAPPPGPRRASEPPGRPW